MTASSTVLETNASGQIVSDQRYYAYGKQRDTGPVSTDYRFTGQKQDASGLIYMNARYYDPTLGQFISPDTLVPDPGVLIDYNRYGYARGNPLKYNDPSGHYSDQALMTHFGCETWACVEANFQGEGAYAAFQGWLDILIAAEDGYLVDITVGAGDSVLQLSGRFATQNGKIVVKAPQMTGRGELEGANYAWDNSWGELDFAKMALMASWQPNHSAVYRTSGATNLYDVRSLDCRHTDCVGRILNATSTGSGAVATACASSVIGNVGCSQVATAVSLIATVVGTARTTSMVLQSDATQSDLVVVVTTFTVGTARRASPATGFVASAIQWLWDETGSE